MRDRERAMVIGQSIVSAMASIELPEGARLVVVVEIEHEDDIESAIAATVQAPQALEMLSRAAEKYIGVIEDGVQPEEVKPT